MRWSCGSEKVALVRDSEDRVGSQEEKKEERRWRWRALWLAKCNDPGSVEKGVYYRRVAVLTKPFSFRSDRNTCHFLIAQNSA